MSFLDVMKRSFGATNSDEPMSKSKQQSRNAQVSNNPHQRTDRVRDGNKVEYFQATAEPSSSREQQRPQRRSSSKTTRSRFSELSCEINQYQKIVRDLDSLLVVSGDSPEYQWRSRILLRSVKEADTDIGNKLAQQEVTARGISDPNVRASHEKLKRDYRRIQESFKVLSSQYRKRQAEAIVQMQDEHGWISPEEMKRKVAAQQEEEFFYRKMRERESELNKMNTSMHKVNDIYEELERIVQDQQEEIDTVEDHIRDAKATTRAGVDRLQQEFPYCGNMDLSSAEKHPQIRTNEEFRISMPFETMASDFRDVVQQDIMGLGSDIVSLSKSRSFRKAASYLQCSSGSIEKSDDDHDDDDDDDAYSVVDTSR